MEKIGRLLRYNFIQLDSWGVEDGKSICDKVEKTSLRKNEDLYPSWSSNSI